MDLRFGLDGTWTNEDTYTKDVKREKERYEGTVFDGKTLAFLGFRVRMHSERRTTKETIGREQDQIKKEKTVQSPVYKNRSLVRD